MTVRDGHGERVVMSASVAQAMVSEIVDEADEKELRRLLCEDCGRPLSAPSWTHKSGCLYRYAIPVAGR